MVISNIKEIIIPPQIVVFVPKSSIIIFKKYFPMTLLNILNIQNMVIITVLMSLLLILTFMSFSGSVFID